MRYVLAFLSFFMGAHILADENTYSEYPTYFQIEQEGLTRSFRILEGEECKGIVINSSYGMFEFYDCNNQKEWTNRYDSLYDNLGNCVGHVKLASDHEWFWERKNLFRLSTCIEIFSDQDELLATVQEEGDGKCFIFRDVECQKPLAIALWSWKPSGTGYFQLLDEYIQSWEVIIIDSERLAQKKIPSIFLTWALLKHSQKHFPDPQKIRYLMGPPKAEANN